MYQKKTEGPYMEVGRFNDQKGKESPCLRMSCDNEQVSSAVAYIGIILQFQNHSLASLASIPENMLLPWGTSVLSEL